MRKLSSANDVAAGARPGHRDEAAPGHRAEAARRHQSSEKQQIELNEQQIESLKRILADQQRRVASMRVTSPEAGQLQALGNPPLELGQYVNAGMSARPRRSARQTQSGSARTRKPGEGRRARAVGDDRPPQQHGREGPRDAHRSVVGSGHGHGRSHDRRSASAGHSLRPRRRRHDSRSSGSRTCCTSGGPVSARRKARSASSKSPRTRAKPSSRHRPARPRLRELIEVKNGLQVGDSVIISDMSQFDATNRVRIK